MATTRRCFVALGGAVGMVLATAQLASAQTPVDPSQTPTENTGGWVFSMAQLVTILGVIIVVMVVVLYMRYAPRFARDEESHRVVRADRVRPGQELPRRAVDLSQTVPVIVAPPSLPAAVGAAASAPAAPAAAPDQAAPAPAPAPAAAAPAAPARAEPGAESHAEPPADEAPASAEAPAAEAPAAAESPAAATPAPAAPPAPAERHEVTMDQEVFESTLAELLAKGTDRRVAEGQARRAGMIAARRKAEGS
jgi:uncharacterized membrane protein